MTDDTTHDDQHRSVVDAYDRLEWTHEPYRDWGDADEVSDE